MINLNSEFETFLSNVEPDYVYVKQASKANNAVRDFLKSSEKFKNLFSSSFLTGSYARSTAIKEIKDVDIMVILDKEPSESEPSEDIKDIFSKLKNALKDEYEVENIEQQQRSVKLIWRFERDEDNESREDDLTIDLVPAIRSEEDSDYNLWIPDKKLEKWIKTNPKGHLDAVTTKNQESSAINGRNSFVPFVKVLKFWRDHTYKIPKRPKGFLLECLAYQHFESCTDNWFDCTLKNIKSILSACSVYKYVENDDNINFVKDIGQEGKNVVTSTTYKDFKKFIEKLEDAKDKMNEASEAENKYDCIKKLQDVFGENYFPAPQESDKEITNAVERARTVTVLTGSNKNPEAKPYGRLRRI